MTKQTWVHTHLPRLSAGDPNCLSIKIPGQRIRYAPMIALRNAIFKVSEPGRQRCIREGVRNVHAWVVGEEIDLPPCFKIDTTLPRAIYDPWKGDSFVDAQTLTPIHFAARVALVGKHVYYKES